MGSLHNTYNELNAGLLTKEAPGEKLQAEIKKNNNLYNITEITYKTPYIEYNMKNILFDLQSNLKQEHDI